MPYEFIGLLLMLSPETVIPYLLDRGTLTNEQIVHDDLSISDLSRRNSNLALSLGTGRGFFLKQGKRMDRFSTVAAEARFYDWLGSVCGKHQVAKNVPCCHFYDELNDILVLEFFEGAASLAAFQTAGRRRFPLWISRFVASVLADLHSSPVPESVRTDPPWVFSLTQPRLDMYSQICSANLELLTILQQYEVFSESFREMLSSWRADSPIHGDLKWDNFIALKNEVGSTYQLRMIDWETFQAGDPFWDVASIVAEHLRFWLNSIPVAGESPTEELLASARFPLEVLQPSMSAFCAAYLRRSRRRIVDTSAARTTIVRYAAAILVQFAYEQLQGQSQISSNIICFLQLSQNMLERPEEAAVHILDLQVDQSAVA